MELYGRCGMELSKKEKRRIFKEEKFKKQMTDKSVVVSVFLSFLIPGLGDLYCGSQGKAITFFLLDVLCLLFLFAMGFGAFLFAPVWFCGLISAWMEAKKPEHTITLQDNLQI